MSDLTALEQRLTAHYATEAPRQAPGHLVEGIAVAVRSTPQRQPWPDRLRGLVPTPVAARLAAVAAALVVVSIGLVALMSGSTPRPDMSPGPSAAPSVRASVMPAPPAGFATFTSTLYGFSIQYPADWTLWPATARWTGGASLFERGTTDVDRIDGLGAWVLKVAAIEVADGTDPQAFADDLPQRPEFRQMSSGGPYYCSPGSGFILSSSPTDRWTDGTVGGLPARVRHDCGIYDAVVIVNGRAYVFSLTTVQLFNYKPGGPRFEELMASVVFEVPSEAAPTATFTSPVYRYSIRVPAGCTVTPAADSWTTLAALNVGTAADRFTCADGFRYYVVAARIAPSMAPAEWVAALPERAERGRCVQRGVGGTTMADAARPDFSEELVAGWPGWVRAACGFVDGVAIVGSAAYVFTVYQGSFGPGGDLFSFDAFVGSATLTPGDTDFEGQPIAGDTSTFTSDLYGYSIRYPSSWTVRPAMRAWSGSGSWSRTADADTIEGDETTSLRVIAVGVAADTEIDSWIAANLPDRPELEELADGHRHCVVRSASGGVRTDETPWTSTWLEATVGDRPARTRDACGFSDAVVLIDRRVYVFSLTTPYDAARPQTGTSLAQLTDTITFGT